MDDYISEQILDNTDIFVNIHPNVITLFGTVLNFFIFGAIINKNYNQLGILMILRWLADTLDGNVARKYNKTSSLGNTLDVTSDCILYVGLIFLLCVMYGIPLKYGILIFLVLLTLSIIYFNALDKNKKKKNRQNNIFFTINNYLTDNSIIVYIISYILIVKRDFFIGL